MKRKANISRTELFLLHIDNKLSPSNAELITNHLNNCQNCRNHYKDAKAFYRSESQIITELVFEQNINKIRNRLFEEAIEYLSPYDNIDSNQTNFTSIDYSDSISEEIQCTTCGI